MSTSKKRRKARAWMQEERERNHRKEEQIASECQRRVGEERRKYGLEYCG